MQYAFGLGHFDPDSCLGVRGAYDLVSSKSI